MCREAGPSAGRRSSSTSNKLDKGGHFAAWEEPELFPRHMRPHRLNAMGERPMAEDINHDRRRLLGTAAMTIGAASLGMFDAVVPRVTSAGRQLPVEGEMPSLARATGWINSPPLTVTGLRGTVVLIDFWTYTCINWLRTLPYVRAWAEKYQDRGLVVVGVHTPEFDFEHDLDNVRRQVKDLRVHYPVVVDNDYAIWSAFDNHYWPALYVVDAQGQIRHHQFGEGGYQQAEMIVQQLLAEVGGGDVGQDLVAVDPAGVEAAADWDSLW